jgi:hypothetical protein
MAEKKAGFFDKVVEIIRMWNKSNIDMKIDFIKIAIADTQDTIRAIDIKVEIVLGILVLVMTGIFTNLPDRSHFCLVAAIMSFLLLSAISVIYTLSAVNNPAKNVCVDKTKYKNICGLFYGAKYILDGKVDCDKFFFDINSKSGRDLLNELTFDFMKLIYIRNRKIKGQKWAFRFAIITIILYMALLLIQKYIRIQVVKNSIDDMYGFGERLNRRLHS